MFKKSDGTFSGDGVLVRIEPEPGLFVFDCDTESYETVLVSHPALSDGLVEHEHYSFSGFVNGHGECVVSSIATFVPAPRIEREQGVQLLIDPFDQIVLGDQHHADAMDALRNARDKSYLLIIEDGDDDKPSMMMWLGCPGSERVFPLYRLAKYAAAAAAKVHSTAANLSAALFLRGIQGGAAYGRPAEDSTEGDSDA